MSVIKEPRKIKIIDFIAVENDDSTISYKVNLNVKKLYQDTDLIDIIKDNSDQSNADVNTLINEKGIHYYDVNLDIPKVLLQIGVKDKKWKHVQDVSKANRIFFNLKNFNNIDYEPDNSIIETNDYCETSVQSLIHTINIIDEDQTLFKNSKLLNALAKEDFIYIKKSIFDLNINRDRFYSLLKFKHIKLYDLKSDVEQLYSKDLLEDLIEKLQTEWDSNEFETLSGLLSSNDRENHLLAVSIIHSSNISLNLHKIYHLLIMYHDNIKNDLFKGVIGQYIHTQLECIAQYPMGMQEWSDKLPFIFNKLIKNNMGTEEHFAFIADAFSKKFMLNNDIELKFKYIPNAIT